jgi:hypothetical protein
MKNIIIPCTEDVVTCVLGDNYFKVINKVPLPTHMILRGIEDMRCNTGSELHGLKAVRVLLF